MAETRTAMGLFGKGIYNKVSALTPAETLFFLLSAPGHPVNVTGWTPSA